MEKIKYLVLDVDGTLTDGKIYMGQDGELLKAFDVKDGYGIKEILPKYGIKPIIITARNSMILENRCKEIGITEVYQGFRHKLGVLKEIIGGDFEKVVYIGDDLPDIPCMEAVREAGGLVFCPANAIPEVKMLADYISGYKAGEGAVRDCINHLIQLNVNGTIGERVERVVKLILEGKFEGQSDGILEDGSRFEIQEYTSKEEEECTIETHRHHIDIQYIIEGHEKFKMYASNCLIPIGEYNMEHDIELWNGGILASSCLLNPGSVIVVYNGQPHKGGIICTDKPEKIKKLVCKIETKI